MSLTYTNAAAPESAYNTANDQLARGLQRLDELVLNLRHRLEPVLVPIGGGDKAGDGAKSISPVPAPLVATLEHHAARAENSADELADLLRRLCL